MKKEEYTVCDICGQPIYYEDDEHEGDVYYEIDGQTICNNEKCIEKALEPYRREAKHERF